MSTRKDFIAAAASVPLIAAAPAAQRSPVPTPTPKKREISQAAKALAARMQRFDSGLSERELEEIAAGIDGNLKAGEAVNPHGTALKNSDEPATIFEVEA